MELLASACALVFLVWDWVSWRVMRKGEITDSTVLRWLAVPVGMVVVLTVR
ncbi:hypothetical protein K3217_21440 [bacterium BD-1]|nr:hypothetical protein [Ottowia caeni]